MNPITWTAPAGVLLDKLAKKLSSKPPRTIIVFGSGVLQLRLEPSFISRDVDVVGDEELAEIAKGIRLPDERVNLEFQVCDSLTFRTALGWEARAYREERHGHTFVFPHAWDILVAKLGRLEEKDLEAYRLVIRKTGHPTAGEFKKHLQFAVDLYRPNFDEERGTDYATQTKILWQTIYCEEIDVQNEIIRPALARRQAEYDADAGDPDLKKRLRNLGR